MYRTKFTPASGSYRVPGSAEAPAGTRSGAGDHVYKCSTFGLTMFRLTLYFFSSATPRACMMRYRASG